MHLTSGVEGQSCLSMMHNSLKIEFIHLNHEEFYPRGFILQAIIGYWRHTYGPKCFVDHNNMIFPINSWLYFTSLLDVLWFVLRLHLPSAFNIIWFFLRKLNLETRQTSSSHPLPFLTSIPSNHSICWSWNFMTGADSCIWDFRRLMGGCIKVWFYFYDSNFSFLSDPSPIIVYPCH